MRNNSQENFLQPIVSTTGIFVSLLSAISPIFSYQPIISLFIYPQLAPFSGFAAFIFGMIAIWLIFEHYRFINIPIGKMKDRGKGFIEPSFRIDKRQLILILFITDILLALIFLYIKTQMLQQNFEANLFIGFSQVIVYILFFIILVSMFAMLITSTLERIKYEQDRDDFPWLVFSTLEKNKLVSAGIEFYENTRLSPNESIEHGIIGGARKITVKTIPQKEMKIKCILSHDGKELIKIVKKENRN